MALAASLQSIASKLVDKFGGDITYRQISGSAYNTTTGAVTETATDTAIKGVLDRVSKQEINELIHEQDKKLIVAAADLPAAASLTDRVVISNVVHQIIKIDVIEQDNTAISYELFLRV